MEAAGNNGGFTPPYGSFRTLMNLVTKMEDGLPSRIDRSYMSNLPGSTQSQLLAGMRSLGLIDGSGYPSDTLKRMVANPGEREAIIGDLVRSHYAPALDNLGLNATQAQLEEVFSSWGVTGSTRRKAIAFFIAAAKFAEVPISPHFKTPRVQSSAKRTTRARRDTGFPASPAPDDFKESPPPSSGFHPFIQGLLDTLPEVGTEWPAQKRKDWTEAASRIFNIIYELPPDENEGGDPDS